MKYSITLLLACVAVAAWGGVFFFGASIEQSRVDYQQHVSDLQQETNRQAVLARLSKLAKETADERAQLDTRSNIDVVAAATLIEAIGAQSGAVLKITNAVSNDAPHKTTGLHNVDFLIESDGSFSAVMRSLRLLEGLPAAVTIANFDLSAIPDASKTTKAPPQWQLITRLRLLTTATISS